MKSILILVSNILLLASCQPDPTQYEVAGTYIIHGFNHQSKLVLRTDGSFQQLTASHDCFGGTENKIVKGRFKAYANEVVLLPKEYHKQSLQQNRDTGKDDLLYDSAYTLDQLTHEMWEYSDTLFVLRWQERLFLLGTKEYNRDDFLVGDLHQLINDVNAGYMENWRWKQYFASAYWNKLCDACDQEDISLALTPKWSGKLLTIPVQSSIESATKRSPNSSPFFDYEITINAGSSNGVWPGMKFYSDDTKDSTVNFQATVFEVKKYSSKAYVNMFGRFLSPGVPVTTLSIPKELSPYPY